MRQPGEVFRLLETFENFKDLKMTLLMVFKLRVDGILGVSTGKWWVMVTKSNLNRESIR